MPNRETLSKEERLSGQHLVDELFGGGHSHSAVAFPLRAVYAFSSTSSKRPNVRLLISVPKRRLHHAVDRNRVKRQLREAYRHHKHILTETLSTAPPTPEQQPAPDDRCLLLALVWMDGRILPSTDVEHLVVTLLRRVAAQTAAHH